MSDHIVDGVNVLPDPTNVDDYIEHVFDLAIGAVFCHSAEREDVQFLRSVATPSDLVTVNRALHIR